ncbi:zinc maintenance protein [Phaeoacremonium minimum UCRPA7]|uniref:Mitochondrial zinc maintenance protein 1, mitochondrial n=1 Tax=Phaeoacremonium minimum (strain UCR-PA7) TaxID=1286976 RepID=R8B914_PHAM7|nr:zinc maintenance protein [Phaeoacremonium minimum UCRPA7]EON95778.1 zinc maintenance protein [Phaeoacremonium minimum UCRPA7]
MSALTAYRHLLRAARIAFEGDTRVLDAARQQIRGGFREKASLPSSDPSTAAAIQHAQEVAAFLKSNVVQGKKEGEDLYRLRIHDETERGDNDTIKVGGGKTIKIDGKKCTDR